VSSACNASSLTFLRLALATTVHFALCPMLKITFQNVGVRFRVLTSDVVITELDKMSKESALWQSVLTRELLY
jgi:hypothetical protein